MTLQEKFLEFGNSRGIFPPERDPNHFGDDARTCFLAGAAAMAELFANGQGLKVTHGDFEQDLNLLKAVRGHLLAIGASPTSIEAIDQVMVDLQKR
jgi:hypothetical protein